MPRLEGQPLLEPSNSFRWLRDRSLRLAELPPAYVEFHGGDRLPGMAIDYRTGQEERFDPLPPHLVVRVGAGVRAAGKQAGAAKFASPCRIGAADRVAAPRPASRISRARHSFATAARSRSARFAVSPGEVHLLLPEGGDRRIAWSDLAELHLPAADAWDAWFDQLAAALPQSRHAAVPDRNHQRPDRHRVAGPAGCRGLKATRPSPTAGSTAFSRRGASTSCGFRSARWSIAAVGCRAKCRSAGCRRAFPKAKAGGESSDQRQLRRRPAAQPSRSISAGDSACTAAARWRLHCRRACDRFARGSASIGPPAKGAASWPACLRMNRLATRSGKGRFWSAAKRSPTPGRSVWPALPADSTDLCCQIDPVAQGRPAGADPLEIRDHADWCDPLLELDPVSRAGRVG